MGAVSAVQARLLCCAPGTTPARVRSLSSAHVSLLIPQISDRAFVWRVGCVGRVRREIDKQKSSLQGRTRGSHSKCERRICVQTSALLGQVTPTRLCDCQYCGLCNCFSPGLRPLLRCFGAAFWRSLLSQTSNWEGHTCTFVSTLLYSFELCRHKQLRLPKSARQGKVEYNLHIHRSRQQTGQGLGDLILEWSTVYACRTPFVTPLLSTYLAGMAMELSQQAGPTRSL
jgi:hypothetical protein